MSFIPWISIHAPVKGATLDGHLFGVFDAISIHAPVKGATCSRILNGCTLAYFNPRTREGCDAAAIYFVKNHWDISIHAPVKGATTTMKI